jgi:hypothetical protein
LTDGHLCLDIAGAGSFEISPSGERIVFRSYFDSTAVDLAKLAAIAFGAPLLLALARLGRFVVHASAVLTDHGAVLFVGASGSGKSTLAAILDGLRWSRLADDLAALDARAPALGPRLLTRLPQPRLSFAQQPTWAPESVPVAALFALVPRSDRVALQPMTKSEATLEIVRHTAAARLFDRPLLEHQLDFAAALAEKVPIARLCVPWRAGVGPELIAAVSRALAGLAPKGSPCP